MGKIRFKNCAECPHYSIVGYYLDEDAFDFCDYQNEAIADIRDCDFLIMEDD